MNTTPWDHVRARIDEGDLPGLVAAVIALDPAGRREVARELPGHVKVAQARAQRALADHETEVEQARLAAQLELGRLRDSGELTQNQYERAWNLTWSDHDEEKRPDTEGWKEPMRVAGAGVIGGAAAVVGWINRREFDRWDRAGGPAVGAVEPLLQVIGARPATWQADLAVRLALRLRTRRRPVPDRTVPLALALLRDTGATPPEHDPLVVAWVSRDARLSELRTDPLLGHLLPRIFHAEGVGRALRDQRPDSPTSWLVALRTLAAEGRVDRVLLLDGCRRRFLLGGEPADLRFFVRLHRMLQPTRAEIEPHAVDYLRLLPAAPGPVAELALGHLRGLAGLDLADVAEGLEGLLFRAEIRPALDGLSWLEASLRAAPGRADELAPALATALGHESHSVRERAVRVAHRQAVHFTPIGAETLRDAIGALPPHLRDRLAAVFGGRPVE